MASEGKSPASTSETTADRAQESDPGKVIEVEPGRKVVWAVDLVRHGVLKLVITITLAPLPGGNTALTVRSDFSGLLRLVVRRPMFDDTMAQDGPRQLKTHIESQGTEPRD